MARPRTATAILEAKGTFVANPKRRRGQEPTPPSGPPRKPAWLQGRASQLWDEYGAICRQMGTMARGDEPEFATWCCLQAEFEADQSMHVARIAQKRAYAERFGIAGGGSRAKMAKPYDGNKTEDPADKYFGPRSVGPSDKVC